jgi:hypothetical protein
MCEKCDQENDMLEIAAGQIADAKESGLSPLEWSRKSAADCDEKIAGNQRLQMFLYLQAMLGGQEIIPAVEIQARIEANWATISKLVPMDFPYINYFPIMEATGMVIESRIFADKELGEMAKRTVFINPASMRSKQNLQKIPPSEPDFGIPHDLVPVWTFVHELRHLHQHATGRWKLAETPDGFRNLWDGKVVVKPKTMDRHTYLNLPHEKDANTTATMVCNTIVEQRQRIAA